MDLQIDHEVAIVIGGAKGIGRAIGEAFLREHASVVLADIDPIVNETAHEAGDQADGTADGIVLDATDFSAVQALAASVVSTHGECHHLVFAAGTGSGKYGFPFWNLTPADWEHVLRVNLIGAVNAAHAFAPQLVSQRRGTMLFLSSIAGQIGSQTDPPYSAAKAGVINFAQCAAKDLAEYNVRVNTICPGMVKTDVNQAAWRAWHEQQPAGERMSYDQWANSKIKRVAPLGRWQTVADIAELAVFLASPRAHNITGQTLNVDGGQVMHS
ncbi:MAG: SDR family oxidoreductase [Pirellulaceae bacterium]|nr:SDR family oxidoreductase [Pirellulaceae bacterium]MDP6720060.1 SDR family oxidoreductase [Pirellulaceae bacterium]